MAATPPIAGLAKVRVQPATIAVAARAKEVRIASGIIDGIVHYHDPPKTHGFDLLIRKLFPDKARNLGIRLLKLALISLGANNFRNPVVVFKEHSLDNGTTWHPCGTLTEVTD